jgi:hypothetical protein
VTVGFGTGTVSVKDKHSGFFVAAAIHIAVPLHGKSVGHQAFACY